MNILLYHYVGLLIIALVVCLTFRQPSTNTNHAQLRLALLPQRLIYVSMKELFESSFLLVACQLSRCEHAVTSFELSSYDMHQASNLLALFFRQRRFLPETLLIF